MCREWSFVHAAPRNRTQLPRRAYWQCVLRERPRERIRPLWPASDPDVGYPTEVDVPEYADLRGPLSASRIACSTDIASGRLAFTWTASTCGTTGAVCKRRIRGKSAIAASTSAFPRNEDERAAFDLGKVALCTSADFLKLCKNERGETIPCVCGGNPPADAGYPDERSEPALCSPAYCHCDAQSCEINTAFSVSEDLVVAGEQMTGTWTDSFGDGLSPSRSSGASHDRFTLHSSRGARVDARGVLAFARSAACSTSVVHRAPGRDMRVPALATPRHRVRVMTATIPANARTRCR